MATKKKEVKEVVTNKAFSENDENFKRACEAVGVASTTRQASKFRMGKGSAFKNRKHVKGDN